MGRFSAAKMFGAIDKKFQDMYNSLIDLLDTGYSVSTTLGGKKVKIDINAKEGISITVDGVKAFGVASDGRVFTQSISNVDDSENYGEIGIMPSGFPGFRLVSPEYNYFRLTRLVGGGFGLIDHNGIIRMSFSLDGTTYIKDQNDVIRLYVNADGAFGIYDDEGNPRCYISADKIFAVNGGQDTRNTIIASATETFIRQPGATHHALGVDATGPYKIISGVKTYL